MTPTRSLVFALLVAIALPLAGCVQNVADLKDKLTANAAKDEATKTAADDLKKGAKDPASTNKTNATTVRKSPPVARMTVFGEGGVLVFRASFIGEDQTEAVSAKLGNFTLISTESEALTPGAKLSGFKWEVDGKVVGADKKGNAVINEPGAHVLKLTVTDSDGLTDSQTVNLFIAPEPFEVQTVLTGGPLAGTSGVPTASGAHEFTVLAEQDGSPIKAMSMVVTLATGAAHDAILTVADPAGTATTVDSGGAGGGESLRFEAPAAGKWTFTADTFAGASPDHTITVTIVYVQVVEGADEHGGHHH